MKVFEIGDSCISQIFGSPSGDYREIYEIDSRSETGNGEEDKKNLQKGTSYFMLPTRIFSTSALSGTATIIDLLRAILAKVNFDLAVLASE